ncbi:MAG TPA: hypothetical protein VN722_07730 [Hanamia sp.]|nr:hypothetical protein [Hanamia sp.]
MDVIKLIGASHNGKLIIDVPEELDEKELEIMIISSKELKKEEENYDGKAKLKNEDNKNSETS